MTQCQRCPVTRCQRCSVTLSVQQTERRLVGAAGAASSEDEPPEDAGAGERRGPAPLLDRIRRDRQDLEAKIAKLKGYISASSEMMNKLKDLPVRRDVDFGLTIAHAGGSPGQPERRNCRLSRHAIVYGGTVYIPFGIKTEYARAARFPFARADPLALLFRTAPLHDIID